MRKIYIPRRSLVMLGTFLLTVLLYIDRACISTAKEEISAELNFDLTDFGWIMAIFTLGYAMFQTPSGLFADKRGAKSVITTIVAIWSTLTAITGLTWNYVSMLVVRFLFGAGEAGAFPSISKTVFHWFPMKERGIVQGINFSGSRIGAALAMPLVAWMIMHVGWRLSFVILGAVGFIFTLAWHKVYKNTPEEVKNINEAELNHIIKNRQTFSEKTGKSIRLSTILKSRNVWMAMLQYCASNFTFYFTLAWMYPYLKEKFSLGGVEAGWFAMFPLIAGACGNWFSGFIVDAIYKRRKWNLSRRLPAITGFILAASGMVLMAIFDSSPYISILFLSLAIFGADMTLSPSWAFCIDIGKQNAGLVSGTMNMAGNLGAFVTIVAFPYLLEWTGKHETFFYICCMFSVLGIAAWFFMNPEKSIRNN